jgi:oxaloacetate decarboxylase beta subunit
MENNHLKPVSQRTRILFPVAVAMVSGLLVPSSASLIGMLMFGNLLRESGVVDRLSKGAQNELANIITLLLGI